MTFPEAVRTLTPSVGDWRAARAAIELSMVAAGGLSGALHGMRRGYDVIGVAVIALVTGLGGGILRDVLIAHGPVLALRHPVLLLTGLAAGGVGIVLGQHTAHLRVLLWAVEALSLGLATVAGIQRAEEVGLHVAPALLLGVLTGTGGGLLRDVICRETPMLLLPGEPYAAVALFGGVVYHIFRHVLRWPMVSCELLAIASSFGLRALASWRRWLLPKADDFARTLQGWPRRRWASASLTTRSPARDIQGTRRRAHPSHDAAVDADARHSGKGRQWRDIHRR